MIKQEFEYYAFISYCRADEKWAKWIQHKLETYRFPTALRKENRRLPRKIFPVFRDKTDLTSGVLWNQLKQQLEESEYLIVICSPRSAGAEWVGKEIAYFQELGRNKNIIPLIVDGKPHAEDKAEECYHPALSSDPEQELLGVGIRELGKNNAALRVIASMMNLRYDQLAMRDARRTRRRRAIAAGVSAALLAVFSGVAWYAMPHSRYYWSYVYVDEKPVGLSEVSRAERKTAHDYYKIIEQYNRPIRIERVNSAGTVTNGVSTYALDEYPVIEFDYTADGKLRKVTQTDVYGDVRLIKNYSEDLGAVDFKNPYSEAKFGALPANLGANSGIASYSVSASGASEITRQLQEYDEDGYLVKVLYKRDNLDTPACDTNGIYGKAYERNEDGTVRRVVNLGKDGLPLRMQFGGYGTSIVYTDYEYDSHGRIVKCFVYDAEGQPTLDEKNVFCWEDIYNDFGCVEQVNRLDTEGNLAPSSEGIAKSVLEYDKSGFWETHYYYNADGSPAYDNQSGVFGARFQNDTDGRQVGGSFYDANGNPMICNQGYASWSVELDTQGRPLAEWYYGSDGELTCAYDTLNAAGWSNAFSDDDRTLIKTYYGKDGNISLNKDGYAVYVQKTNEQGLVYEMDYLDAEYQPVRCRLYNAASIVYDYDNVARLTSVSYYDENGAPCRNTEGAARIEYGYNERGFCTSEAYYDEEGNLCYIDDGGKFYARKELEFNDYGWATQIEYYDINNELQPVYRAYRVKMEYDERGNRTKYAYYDHMGNLLNNSYGYAIEELTYNARGQVVANCYRDQQGNYVTGQSYLYESEYDLRGNLLRSTSYTLEEDGSETSVSTCYEYDERDILVRTYYEDGQGNLVEDEHGFALYEHTLDERGRAKINSLYNQSGELKNVEELTYDEYNHISEQRYYSVVEQDDSQTSSPLGHFTYAYDDYGNQTEERIYNASGDPLLDSDGVAYTERTYDVMGNCIREVCRDSNGEAMMGADGYAAVEMRYDAAGHIVQYDYYDVSGAPMTQESGHSATKVQRWNAMGVLEEEIIYDEKGNYFESENQISRIYHTYRGGTHTTQKCYNAQNELIYTFVIVACVGKVFEDSQADLAGVQENDLMLQYDSWDYFSYDGFESTDFEEMNGAINNSSNRSRTVRMCKANSVSEDGGFVFEEYTFETGLTGVTINNTWLEIEGLMEIREQYMQWLAEKQDA